MTSTVQLPLWFVFVVVALAVLALINHFFLPGIRWFFRRRVNRVIQDVNDRLRLKLPIFQLTKRQVLIDRLTYDPEVMKLVEQVATERGVTRDGVMAEVVTYAREMVPSFNPVIYFQLGYRVARWFLRSFYWVRLGFAHEKALSQFPENSSVVFVINHRSNMDYMLVTYLASQDTAMSYGAGEWARIWPLRAILRSAGAYILRRNASDDNLYRKVLERYVQMATEGGVPHAIFAEGRLSRNGMVNPPKLGLMGYIIRTFDPRGARDILFVPVGVNFDRVFEERTLIANAETDFRGRGSIFVLGSTLRFLGREVARKLTGRRHGFGTACASFGKPLSLKDWSAQHKINLSAMDKPAFFAAVETLGSEITERIIKEIPVLAVPLLSMLLLERGSPADATTVLTEADEIVRELRGRGAHIGFEQDGDEPSLKKGLRLMTVRGLVLEDDAGLLSPASDETVLLQYYANSVIQLRSKLGAQ
ncbi:MAG: 1-acyl-sn-glycerol-3-phosphate acyltransferase [Hyphomicrobiales bacterium]